MSKTLKEIAAGLPIRYGDDDAETNTYSSRYFGWGPYEDYMIVNGEGWNSVVVKEAWEEFYSEFQGCDDDLNVVADFYFAIEHDSVRCDACRNGYNPATQEIYDGWYGLPTYRGGWRAAITQDEVEALWERGRLKLDFREHKDAGTVPSAAEVNEKAKSLFFHDSINAHICVETRATRLGVYGLCEKCGGNLSIRTGPDRLALLLWMLHPRKGASRGVHVKSVSEQDIPQVKAYLARQFRTHTRNFAWALESVEASSV